MDTEHPLSEQEPKATENLSTHPRKWWIAALLHILTLGLGQIYNGQAKKGLLSLGFFVVVLIVMVLFMMGLPVIAPFNVVLSFLLFLSFYIYVLKDAVSTARKLGSTYKRKVYNKWYLYVGITLIPGFVVSPVVKNTIAEAYRIPSGGMEPTLLVGDYMLANKMTCRFKEPKNGDVIVFTYPGDGKTKYVKRLIATSGQTVEIINKKVFVDGEEILLSVLAGEGDAAGPILPHYPAGPHAPFTFNVFDGTTAYNRDNFGPYKVPSDSFFVMGDNRDGSFDSRFWGPVPTRLIIGKATITHWSWDHANKHVRWERIGKAIR